MEVRKKYEFKNIDISYDQLIYKVGSYHYNWHYEIELLWLLTGKIEVNVEGDTFGLEEGDLLIINSNCGHATFASVPNSIAMRLYISPDFFTSQGLDLSKGRFEMNAAKERMNPLYDELRRDLAKLQLLSEANSANQLSHNGLLFTIAEKMTKFFLANTSKTSTYTVGQKKEFLDFAIQYIEDNFKSDITLEILAQHCNYSTPYLSRMFKSELGINFYEYLTRCRLQHAIRLLATTEKKSLPLLLKMVLVMLRPSTKCSKSILGRHLLSIENKSILIFKRSIEHLRMIWMWKKMNKLRKNFFLIRIFRRKTIKIYVRFVQVKSTRISIMT